MPAPVKTVLITHSAPSDETSPYHMLAQEWKLKLDFLNFIEIEGISTSEFRKQNIYPLDFSAIIFTSKHAVDHFFRICKDLRIEMPPETKYFCMSEALSKYLQKYIVIRKRKLYVGDKTLPDLFPLIAKHSKDTYLFPTGENGSPELEAFAQEKKLSVEQATVYQTLSADLSGLKEQAHDLICFYSPTSVEAYVQAVGVPDGPRPIIAVFGSSTAKAAEEAGLPVAIQAPTPEKPSMTMALEAWLKANPQPLP